jgi:hypothetical protein
MTRPRVAPSASRTAISFRRDDDRASIRLATLAAAISSTSPTAPSSTSRAGRMSPVSCSCIATTVTPHCFLKGG